MVRWIDGDSAILRVDLGFHLWMETRFRLVGIDTPERGRPGAAEATALVNELAPPGAAVVIDSRPAADKYGRWLATVRTVGGVVVNTALLERGMARPYDP